MRIVRNLSLLLNIVAAGILVVWGLYEGIGSVAPGVKGWVEVAGREFFSNTDIPVPVRISVPMLVLGVILFFTSGGGKKERVSGEEDSPEPSRKRR